jgi:hypothetical protein
VDHQATVLLQPQSWTETDEIVARITGAFGQTLIAELLEQLPLVAPEALKGKSCRARLLLSEQTYQFNTNITDVRPDGDAIRLTFNQPVRIQGETRRRLPRLRFAESSTVHLLWRDEEEMYEGAGTLGNVSADGAAILIDHRAAEALACADTVFVEFSLPRCPEQFRLPAYIKGITPGADIDRAVLSLKFQENSSIEVKAQINVLKAYLNQHLGQSTEQEAEK